MGSGQQPVTGAKVTLYDELGFDVSDPKPTDARGEVRFAHLPPGDYVAYVDAGGLRFSSPIPLLDADRRTPTVIVAPEASP